MKGVFLLKKKFALMISFMMLTVMSLLFIPDTVNAQTPGEDGNYHYHFEHDYISHVNADLYCEFPIYGYIGTDYDAYTNYEFVILSDTRRDVTVYRSDGSRWASYLAHPLEEYLAADTIGDVGMYWIEAVGKKIPVNITIPIFDSSESLMRYFKTGDESGWLNKPDTVDTYVDTNALTTNLTNGSFDASIPALSGLNRVDNGRSEPLHSYTNSVTFSWTDLFNDNDYFIQTRTTFRYKLNADKVWSSAVIDTCVPTGRYSCFVDSGQFSYEFGDYVYLYYKQDNSIFTDDDMDRQGNIQVIKDSIRIVKISDSDGITYGPWTTFTLVNNVWDSGVVEDVVISDEITEDNEGGNIPSESNPDGDDLLTQFDFTNITGIWSNFIGMISGLLSFVGQFPSLFAKVFSFLPYEIRNTVYLTFVSLCGIALIKAVIT